MNRSEIKITPLFLLNSIVASLLILNTTIFGLRVYDVNWWVADYISYYDVDFALHLKAFLFFIFYLSIYYFLCLIFVTNIKTNHFERKNLRPVFIFVLILFTIQIFMALYMGVGVAGGVGEAPLISYIVLLFSFDAFFYAYVLKEKNKNRVLFSTLMFVISNIVRGWAGFIIFLPIIYFLRRGSFRLKYILASIASFVLIIPVLMVVRDYFRGGYSAFDFLVDEGFSGRELYLNYLVESYKLLLSRFDFYSNYIGVYRVYNDSVGNSMCMPIQENIFYKVYQIVASSIECKPLGGILPGELYAFFIGKGTSYSIVSGFFALPFDKGLGYFISYFFILIITLMFSSKILVRKEYVSLHLILVFMLLFQGWMYQYIYNFLGFVFGVLATKFVFGRKDS